METRRILLMAAVVLMISGVARGTTYWVDPCGVDELPIAAGLNP